MEFTKFNLMTKFKFMKFVDYPIGSEFMKVKIS